MNYRLLLLIILIGPKGHAVECQLGANSIDSVQINSTNLNYKYKFLKGSDSTKPVVIYLPGGPGSTSISDEDTRLSKDYGMIQTDPRGTGCNANLYDPNVNLTTTDLAKDVFEIIKKENLTHYIIYGHSYGTALATVLTYYIEAQNTIPRPAAVVLEGVLGRVFLGTEEDQGYLKEWFDFKGQSTELERFRNSYLELGFTPLELGNFISTLLLHGQNPAEPNISLLDFFLGLSGTANEDILKEQILSFNEPYEPELVQLYRQIGCEEISESGWSYDKSFIDGELVLKPSKLGICEGFSFQQPYDSYNYILQTPIYYFNGIKDPATPYWQSEYHQSQQILAKKNVINVVNGGHMPLEYNLSDCSEFIWHRILRLEIITEKQLEVVCALETKVDP